MKGIGHHHEGEHCEGKGASFGGQKCGSGIKPAPPTSSSSPCSRVKFWIIKNYMSPQHRATLPDLARQYGFDYEFVTYKWPHWLHKQVWNNM